MGCGKSKADKGATGGSSNDDAQKAKRDKEKQEAKSQNKDFQANMVFLAQVPLLKRLPKDQHPLLASSCIGVDFKKGENIIKQGDIGNEFFVIKSGTAAVMIKDGLNGPEEKKVATLKDGDYFGENALLRDEPRTATIVAESSLACLKITREKFQELGLDEKLQFAKRNAVAGGQHKGGELKTKEPTPKNAAEEKLIAEALKGNENLQTMVTLDDKRVKDMIDVAWKEDVTQGQDLIVEGDLQADYFYVVQSGSFDILISDQVEEGATVDPTKQKHFGTVSQGGSFGELALLYLVPRAATIRAKDKSVVWVIDRKNFKNILMKVSDEKIKEYVKLLDAVELLDSLRSEEKQQVAQALIEMHFTKGEVVLQQGEPGNTFYILYEGEVSVIKDGKTVTNLSANQSTQTSQCFGERALLKDEPRAATVKVVSETAKALALDRDCFTMLLGPLEDIMKAHEAGTALKKADKKGETWERKRIARKDLQKLGLLGCGGFGYVELWEHTKTKETYAMKALNKGYIVKTHMQDGVMNEKLILMMTNSQFIIRLYDTYNGQQTLYFLLEPALGGELHAVYHRKGFHGSEKHALYYIAGVVCAFEHLHDRHIIYRDLKPENLLITHVGHTKLTDMGLAKFVIGRTFTTCGTPDYFAPELIASTGHTKAVDWWTLGILLFEFMSGHPPFESPHPMQIYSKVMKGINKVPFPPKCQGAVADLVRGLLQKDPSERLPMRPGGVQNIRTHKWMATLDWDGLMADPSIAEPPYKPPFKGPKDISNFNARREDMPRQMEYHDDGTGWDKDF